MTYVQRWQSDVVNRCKVGDLRLSEWEEPINREFTYKGETRTRTVKWRKKFAATCLACGYTDYDWFFTDLRKRAVRHDCVPKADGPTAFLGGAA